MNLKLLLIILTFALGIDCVSQTLIPYYHEGKYGYCDTNGIVKIAPKYDKVEFFLSDAIAIVIKDNRKVIIDKNGLELSSYANDIEIRLLPATYSTDNRGWRRGAVSRDTIKQLKWVMLDNGECQLLNLITKTISSRYVLDARDEGVYSYIRPRESVEFYHGYFIGEKSDGSFEILNVDGDVLKSTLSKPTIWGDELITFGQGDYSYLFNPKSGYTKEYSYKSIVEVVEGKYLIVSTHEQHATGFALHRKNTKYGVVSVDGQVILDTIYQGISPHNGVYVLKRNGNAFLSDLKRDLLDTSEYKSIYPINDSLFKATRHDDKVQVVELLGKITLEGQVFDTFKFIKDGNYYTSQKGDIVSVLDSALNVEISYEASSIHRVSSRNNDSYLVSSNGLYGIIDSKGEIIIPFEFDRCYYRSNNFYILNQGDKNGLANAQGEIILQPEYEEIEFEVVRNETVLRPRKNGRYASFDLSGKQLSAFESRSPHLSGRSVNWHRHENSYHFTDIHGNPLNVDSKDFFTGFTNKDSVFVAVLHVRDTINEVIIDGKLFEHWGKEFDSIVKVNISLGLIAVVAGNKQGVIDVHGNIISPFSEQEITEINKEFFVAKKEGKYFLFTPEGQQINEAGYDYIDESSINGRRSVFRIIPDKFYEYVSNPCFTGSQDTILKPQRNVGYIDKFGHVLVPLEYRFTLRFFENYACLSKGCMDGQKQAVLVDTLGEVFLETNYDWLYPLNHTDKSRYYVAKLKERYGLIDIEGTIVIPFDYTAIQGFYGDKIISVRDDNHDWHLVTIDGKRLFSGNYDYMSSLERCYQLSMNKFLFFPNGKSVVMDLDGRTHLAIASQKLKFLAVDGIELIEVEMNDYKYYVNKRTLIEYKNTSN
ncbi:WG repeat-containing protein [Lewinella sp. LCG006]|uniref:WG repeat-containing protein n=1 Tax=Lewinella sp. LCG006 TaxID=3231911 RepID=UPI0034613F5B